MSLFGWHKQKRAVEEEGRTALQESVTALEEVKVMTQQAKTVSARLKESRETNHYAERLRFAYELTGRR